MCPSCTKWRPLLQCIGLILLSGEIRLCCRAASLAPDTVWHEAGIPTRLDIECVLPHRPRPPRPRPRMDPQRSEGGLQIDDNNGQFQPTNTACIMYLTIQLIDIIVESHCSAITFPKSSGMCVVSISSHRCAFYIFNWNQRCEFSPIKLFPGAAGLMATAPLSLTLNEI